MHESATELECEMRCSVFEDRLKMQELKLTDQSAGHEKAGHEIARLENV